MWEIPDIPNEQIYHHSKPKSMVKCEEIPILHPLKFFLSYGRQNDKTPCHSGPIEESLTRYTIVSRTRVKDLLQNTHLAGDSSRQSLSE